MSSYLYFSDRNLTHIVDIIYVSDHGMAETSSQRIVYLDEIIGEQGVNDILYEDGVLPYVPKTVAEIGR